MVRISVVSKHNQATNIRQIPPAWRTDFDFSGTQDADFLVVMDGLTSPTRTRVPKNRRLCVLPEPPAIKTYSAKFLAQFGSVWTVDTRLQHPGKKLCNSAGTWLYGSSAGSLGRMPSMSYSELIDEFPNKTQLISMVVSTKTWTPLQRFRLQLAKELQRQIGPQFRLYGHGHNAVKDKRDAIGPSRFHVVVENSIFDHYWTEKLADSYLGWSFPFYIGAPNLAEYFDEDEYAAVPSASIDAAASHIINRLQVLTSMNLTAPLQRARDKLFHRHNIFQQILNYVQTYRTTGHTLHPLSAHETLYPERPSIRAGLVTLRRRIQNNRDQITF